MASARSFVRRWGFTAAAVVLTAAAVRLVSTPAHAQQAEPVPYRVELVHNDPYKVSAALNNMAKGGWDFVSSVSRSDAKVLLIFRKAE